MEVKMQGNLDIPPKEWLAELFASEWCCECGRDHRHHTAIPFLGNWFARCDLDPVENDAGDLVMNPEGYIDQDYRIPSK
jgi:hypothetical protein